MHKSLKEPTASPLKSATYAFPMIIRSGTVKAADSNAGAAEKLAHQRDYARLKAFDCRENPSNAVQPLALPLVGDK